MSSSDGSSAGFVEFRSAQQGAQQRRRRPAWTRGIAAAAVISLLALAGCSDSTELTPDDQTPTAGQSEQQTEEPDPSEPDPSESAETDPLPEVPDVPEVSVADVTTVAEDLAAPWGLARLPDGNFLITLRDAAELIRIDQKTGKKTTIKGDGARELTENTVTAGEGGLLGVALSPAFAEDHQVFVYRTSAQGNEVLRGTLDGDQLNTLEVVIDGIPAAQVHNGGGLAFGPDRLLYIGTGDAGDGELAQDIDSLAGKILRVADDGAIPDDNPMPGLAVWSLGHRNVQGFGWDARERMYASEFGASDQDELNVIRTGGNYGWPEFEGPGGEADGFVDPIVSWPTADSSPSGLAVSGEGIYLASLRGERLWRAPLGQVVGGEQIQVQSLLDGEYGRLRNVLVLAGGDLLVLTNNTDGRGDPGENDDLLLRITLEASGDETGHAAEEPVPTD